jgi:hypothetical protein
MAGKFHGKLSGLRQHVKHQRDWGESQAQCATTQCAEVEVAGGPPAVAGPQGPGASK